MTVLLGFHMDILKSKINVTICLMMFQGDDLYMFLSAEGMNCHVRSTTSQSVTAVAAFVLAVYENPFVTWANVRLLTPLCLLRFWMVVELLIPIAPRVSDFLSS